MLLKVLGVVSFILFDFALCIYIGCKLREISRATTRPVDDLYPTKCTRDWYHTGPCNGYKRPDCNADKEQDLLDSTVDDEDYRGLGL